MVVGSTGRTSKIACIINVLQCSNWPWILVLKISLNADALIYSDLLVKLVSCAYLTVLLLCSCVGLLASAKSWCIHLTNLIKFVILCRDPCIQFVQGMGSMAKR